MVKEFASLKDPIKFENPMKINYAGMEAELTASYTGSIDVEVRNQLFF